MSGQARTRISSERLNRTVRSVKLFARRVSWIRPRMTSSSFAVGSPYSSEAVMTSFRVTSCPLRSSKIRSWNLMRLLALGHPVGDERDRELGQVHLVLGREAEGGRAARGRNISFVR